MAWTDKQLSYMDWLNADPSDRAYETEQQVAEALSTTPQTLWNWKKTPGFDEARIKRANLVFHMKSPMILNAMLRNLLSPDAAKEQVQWFRYANMFNLRAMEAGTFDDVRDDAPSNRKELSAEKIQEKLAGMDETTRQQVLGLIYDMQLLPEPSQILQASPVFRLVKEITIDSIPVPDGRVRAGRKRRERRPLPPEPTDEAEE